MSLEYPEFFEQCLAKNRKMRSAVDGTVVQFGAWLKDSKLPFFTDYTDHGVEHLNRVMLTAVALMPLEARQKFSAEDAAILITAILLHDSALHISEAGFYSLIKGKAASNRIEAIDKVEWPELWDEYLFSAKRWDDQKLSEIMGTDENGAIRGVPRDPFDAYQNLEDTDRKLIGEFIRRHHPRLAHEFAVFGVAGPDASSRLTLSQDFDCSLCDLAGLVARSHGQPIRVCLDHLARKSIPLREFQNVHAPFLMALIRLADYLHVEADRTSEVVFRYKHIPSRFSELEHKAHLAVKSITHAVEDPEAIHVTAQPEDVETFLRLKGWLSGIQSELDQSWAVLGEVYGRYETEGLNKLGLRLRRVRSNLDDVEKFASTIRYLPEHITLDVARADLLKLLIGPLYGHDPGIGVRELMQNAVDAVRERRAFVEKHPSYKNTKALQQTGEVEIKLKAPDSSGVSWLVVSDKGIGMTEEVVRDYFLRAGASFRNSDAWKREFEADQQDGTSVSPTKTRVLRSGRFGVGALGTFLLGDEVHVSTRHIAALRGIRFITRLSLAPIELRHDDTLYIGTTISVKLRPEVSKRLHSNDTYLRRSWDWYCLDDPSVIRRTEPSNRKLEQQTVVKLQDLEPNSKWRKICPVKYEAVYWSYEKAPSLICNGIRVENAHKRNGLCEENGYKLAMPNLCVFDPDGVLPLNLQRDSLAAAAFPFEEMLREDVSKDFLAFLIVNTPTNGAYLDIVGMPKYEGYSLGKFSSDLAIEPWVIADGGLCPFSTWNLWRLDVDRLFLRTRYRYGQSFVLDPLKTASGGIPGWLWFNLDSNARSKKAFMVDWIRDISAQKLVQACLIKGKRFVTSSTFAKYFDDVSTYPNGIKRELIKEAENESYCSMATHGCPDTLVDFASLPTPPKGDTLESAPPLLVEVFLQKGIEPKPSTFERLWKEIIEYQVIPFELAQRRAKLAKAYEVLRPYIESHEVRKANAHENSSSVEMA